MFTGITHISVLVPDYDEALAWYTNALGLEARSDESMGGDDYRWVTVAVPGQNVEIVLHKAGTGPQSGTQTHAPGLVIGTNDCKGDVERLRQHGVKVGLEPEEQMWGIQSVIEDPFGNTLVLVQPPVA